MKTSSALAALSIAVALAAAPVGNLSGSWHLNVQKSRWGKHPKPASSVVTIQHKEPALKYSGSIVFPNKEAGEDAASFNFDGAIDGQPYPVTGTLGAGKMSIHRTGPNTTESEFKSDDGELTETVRMTLDGNTLIRTIRAKKPDGETTWTEYYDR